MNCLANGRKAHVPEHSVGCLAGQIVKDRLGGFDILGDVQNRGGIDELAAHFGGGSVYDGQAGGEGVGLIDNAAVNGGFGHLSSDPLTLEP